MRNISIVVALLTIISVASASYDIKYGRHNITQGYRKPGDRLLFIDHAIRPSSFLRVVSTEVDYPARGQPRNTTAITFFRVTDNMRNGKGGYAFVKSGGVGMSYLSLHLKSQRGEGYNFTTEVYGFPMLWHK
uniref:NADH:ubiquinone oxidoreductase intermediate-associated protein 30 domain-containing protein n=1 Tax=Clastoptera arizonana TaxID=38151 RepID=A0A1B6C4F8_9HEMI